MVMDWGSRYDFRFCHCNLVCNLANEIQVTYLEVKFRLASAVVQLKLMVHGLVFQLLLYIIIYYLKRPVENFAWRLAIA